MCILMERGIKKGLESTLDHIVNRINEYVNIFRNDIGEFK